MNLQELETRLQALIEVQLITVMPGQKPEDILVQRLTAAMRSGATPDSTGRLVAPNVFTLLAHPDSLAHWKEPQLLETLVEILETSAQQAQMHFDTHPSITIAEDAGVPRGDFNLIASFRAETLAETVDMNSETPGNGMENEADTIPENAYLIIEGVKVFQLNRPVVNIGRRLDNTLVVDDPRVSRNHAQLRAIKGRYVLFDLNSTGGTFVNGQRANQTVLYPGDVISLAGLSLIFGQDNNQLARGDLSETSPKNRLSADRSTVVIHTMPPTPKKGK